VKQIAPDLHLLRGFPPNAINVYLMGDVLVDAATRHAGRWIMSELKGRTVAAHALTHAHPDHQGASHEVCEKLGLPLWCGENDAEAVEDGRIMERQPRHPINTVFGAIIDRNRESARKLAALEPSVVCFGHGAPLRDPAKLRAFVGRLPGG
jgi:glyoxylase-like metal-dependent hydrolase (beta-lactamase superfamily II)